MNDVNNPQTAQEMISWIIIFYQARYGLKKNKACGMAGGGIAGVMQRDKPYNLKSVMKWENGTDTPNKSVEDAITRLYSRLAQPPRPVSPRYRVTVNCVTADNKAIVAKLTQEEMLDRLKGDR